MGLEYVDSKWILKLHSKNISTLTKNDSTSVRLICADSVDLEVFEGGGGFRGETNCIFGWNSGGFNMAIYGTCVWGLSDYYVYIKDSLIGGSNAIQNWEIKGEQKTSYRLLKY